MQPQHYQTFAASVSFMLLFATSCTEDMSMSDSGPPKTADELFQAELARRDLPYQLGKEGLYEVKVADVTATVSLENVRRDYLRAKDPGIIVRFVDQIDGGFSQTSPNWASVKPFLRYSLEPSDYETGLDDTLYEPVTNDLVKLFVFTSPDGSTITWVSSSMLKDWQVTAAEVMAQADANMNELAAGTVVEVEEVSNVKLGMLSTEETAFKASVILTDRFRELVEPTHGWPVFVVAPARDFVYIIPAQNRDFLGRLGGVVIQEYNESGHPVTPDVLQIGDDGVTAIGTFTPPRR